MLVGKRCTVGNKANKEAEDFKSYEGTIASEPQMEQESVDFWILILVEGSLTRVDTDYLFDIRE